MKTVLIVTRSDDNDCVEWLRDELRARGAKSIRLDTDRYPQEVQLSTSLEGKRSQRTLVVDGKAHDLNRVSALWYRRFFAGGLLPESLGDLRDASVEESRRTLYGTIAALGCFELDSLRAVRSADAKELQLHRARAFGLDVPRTLFSNDPAAVRRFFKACRGEVITKMQNSFAVYRGGEELVVYTTRLKREDLGALDGLANCPMTFQELLPKKLELRSTVVGRRVFTAAVDSQQSEKSKIDWRKDGVGLLEAWEQYALPKPIERALLKLTASFGLNYAAADFVVTPKGKHVFLEFNAGGEFFWLQRKPGLPIVQALAEVLLESKRRAVSASRR
jgi:glutathione synthase/RimK-type ligase-like ATP-grasp enzyme